MGGLDETPDLAESAGAGALAGLRVLDLSRILAGPWASQALADLGAEVIKIERPGSGDDTRSWGPPYFAQGAGEGRVSAYFSAANRGKCSVTIDITSAKGQALVRDLARQSDIVLENFKVGGLRKYGLDYASLAAMRPELVYCSITGFGQTGPYAGNAGYDFLIQAMGGLMSLTGAPDDAPGGGPMKVGVALADIMTGLYATIAILAAIRHRDQTGEGQYIDLSLLDVQVATLANQAMNYLATGTAPERLGNAHPNIVPYQAFPTADGHMVLAIGNDGQFRRFCEVAGRPDLASDERFSSNPARVGNRDILVPMLADIIAARPLDWWVERLEAAGVPAGPINTLDRVFSDPQVLARGMVQQLPDGGGGSVPTVASPINLSKTPPTAAGPVPGLGEHTEPVLRELLGISAEDLAALRDEGVI